VVPLLHYQHARTRFGRSPPRVTRGGESVTNPRQPSRRPLAWEDDSPTARTGVLGPFRLDGGARFILGGVGWSRWSALTCSCFPWGNDASCCKVCSANWRFYRWASTWKCLGRPWMNALLSRSSPSTLPQAAPRSQKRVSKASGTSWAPREARFTS